MPKNDDEKYHKAADWFCRIDNMSLKEAMLGTGFSPHEAQDRTIQKRVRRHPTYVQHKTKGSATSLPNEVLFSNN